MSFDSIDIYTDGSCKPNPGFGGYCALIEYKKDGVVLKEKICRGGDTYSTNNRMEMIAIIDSLEEVEVSDHSTLPTSVTTDSKYAKDGITKHIANWKRNGWMTSQGRPVKNKALWMRLDAVVSKLTVTWFWVKSHAGHRQNELVDKIAKEEAESFARMSVPTSKKRPIEQKVVPVPKRSKSEPSVVSVKDSYIFLLSLSRIQAIAVLHSMGIQMKVLGEQKTLDRDVKFLTVSFKKGVVNDVFELK